MNRSNPVIAYPVVLTPDDNGTSLVTVPDIPEAISFGAGRADALSRAAEAIASALMVYASSGRPMPAPSAANGRAVVEVATPG